MIIIIIIVIISSIVICMFYKISYSHAGSVWNFHSSGSSAEGLTLTAAPLQKEQGPCTSMNLQLLLCILIDVHQHATAQHYSVLVIWDL